MKNNSKEDFPKTLIENIPIIENMNKLDDDGKVIFPKKFFHIIDSIKNEVQCNLYDFYENGDIVDISISFDFHSECYYKLLIYIYSGHILLKEDKSKIREHLETFIAEELELYSEILFNQ